MSLNNDIEHGQEFRNEIPVEAATPPLSILQINVEGREETRITEALVVYVRSALQASKEASQMEVEGNEYATQAQIEVEEASRQKEIAQQADHERTVALSLAEAALERAANLIDKAGDKITKAWICKQHAREACESAKQLLNPDHPEFIKVTKHCENNLNHEAEASIAYDQAFKSFIIVKEKFEKEKNKLIREDPWQELEIEAPRAKNAESMLETIEKVQVIVEKNLFKKYFSNLLENKGYSVEEFQDQGHSAGFRVKDDRGLFSLDAKPLAEGRNSYIVSISANSPEGMKIIMKHLWEGVKACNGRVNMDYLEEEQQLELLQSYEENGDQPPVKTDKFKGKVLELFSQNHFQQMHMRKC